MFYNLLRWPIEGAHSIKSGGLLSLWLRWLMANAFGEMLGLGATFALGVFIFTRLGDGDGGGVGMALLSFAISVACGVIEATLVGLLQWWAMRPWFPAIRARAWWLATIIGALVAYVLGFLPSTLMSLGEQTGAGAAAAPMAEPPQWIVLLLAAGLGLAGGAVLSFAQWRVLRKAAGRAGGWIPANMLAWMAGMPLIFWGIDAAQKGQPVGQAVLLMAGVLFATGALVGAVHGLFLVWLARRAL
jgi:hypothetical protein